MTRYDVQNRVRDELEAAWPGDQAFFDVTVDDIDYVTLSIREALDDVREQLASAERAERATEKLGS